MKSLMAVFAAGIAALINTNFAEAKTVRANELNAQVWSQLESGEMDELTVEFRQGDEIPILLQATGDLIESKAAGSTLVTVKRSFWVRVKQDQILLSLDGAQFKPVKELISGSFQVGASSDQNGGPANAINMLFNAHLKP